MISPKGTPREKNFLDRITYRILHCHHAQDLQVSFLHTSIPVIFYLRAYLSGFSFIVFGFKEGSGLDFLYTICNVHYIINQSNEDRKYHFASCYSAIAIAYFD